MELRIGLYEFFAYTLGGAAYFVAAAFAYALWSGQPSTVATYANLTAVQLVAAGVGAYVVGLILDLPARGLLRAFFRTHAQKTAAKRLKETKVIDDALASAEWPLILSEMSLKYPSIVRNADSYKAAAILLRNVALAGTLLLVASVPAAFSSAVSAATGLLFASAAVTVALCAGSESRKFDKWFYSSLYERIAVVRRLKLPAITARAADEAG